MYVLCSKGVQIANSAISSFRYFQRNTSNFASKSARSFGTAEYISIALTIDGLCVRVYRLASPATSVGLDALARHRVSVISSFQSNWRNKVNIKMGNLSLITTAQDKK